jgi:8-oxo-dGTP diphosphatase
MQHVENFLHTFAKKEKERFKLKVGVFLFLIQDDHILLSKRAQTGIDDGNYLVPMGGIDGNESLSSALIREAHEEVNINLEPHDLTVCHVMHRLHHMPYDLSFEQIDVYFSATRYDGVICNNEPDKCSEVNFYPCNNLPENTVPFIRHALEATFKKQFFSEFGWD